MADIFLSYAREDESRIRELVAAFEAHGWSVFWDRRIPAGMTWRSYIGNALQQARCVVVAWSTHSVESQWVAEEADEGKARQALLPVMLDAVQPPRGFREIQAADLSGWQPGQASERFDQLMADLHRMLERSATPGATSVPTAAPTPATAPVPARATPDRAARDRPAGPAATAASASAAAQVAPAAAPAAAAPSKRPILVGAIALAALALAIAGWFGVQATGGDRADRVDRPSGIERSDAWIVVAGSFPRAENAAAEQRRAALAAAGIESRVADSDRFPLLAPNLWVVAVGPFDSRAGAEGALARVKAKVPDAYVKKAR